MQFIIVGDAAERRRDDDALPPSGLTLGQRTQIGVSLTKNARSCEPDVNARGGEVIFRWRELAIKSRIMCRMICVKRDVIFSDAHLNRELALVEDAQTRNRRADAWEVSRKCY